MKCLAIATLLLMLVAGSAQAGQGRRGASHAHLCRAEVLFSEELPIGPQFFHTMQFYHTIKATLLVTPPGGQPFETTLYKVIPWQVPPPRRGQRIKVWCEPALASVSFRLD